MSDTSGDIERPEADSGDRPAEKAPSKRPSRSASKTARKPASKTASKTATKAARKSTKSGAPRAQARKPADDRQHDERQQDSDRQDSDRQDSNQQQDGRRDRPKGTRLAVLAAEQLVGLTGKEFEGIVGLSKSDDGWSVFIEVLEMRRIPSTTDVIAVYEVDVDQDGDMTGYRRQRRFLRGEAGEDR